MTNRLNCKHCSNAIRQPQNHLKCSICRCYYHRNCTRVNVLPFYCTECISSNLPFQLISNDIFHEVFAPSTDEIISDMNDNFRTINANLPDILENSDLCSYHDIDSFNEHLTGYDSNSDLLILSVNIASLCKNQHKIEQFLSSTAKSPSIIAISETKIRTADNITDSYNLEKLNYSFEHADTPTHFGGVGLYINNNIDYELRKDLSFDLPRCENLWIEFNPKLDGLFGEN